MSRSDATEPDTPPLRQYVEVLRRRRRTLLIMFSAVLVAAIAFVAALPSLYRASATVLIEGHLPPLAEAPSGGTVDDRLEAIKQEALTRARLSGDHADHSANARSPDETASLASLSDANATRPAIRPVVAL